MNHTQQKNKKSQKDRSVIPVQTIRYRLSIVILILVTIVTVAIVFQASAVSALDKLQPVLMFVIGYYFGKK